MNSGMMGSAGEGREIPDTLKQFSNSGFRQLQRDAVSGVPWRAVARRGTPRHAKR
jgi:hypothetical protein